MAKFKGISPWSKVIAFGTAAISVGSIIFFQSILFWLVNFTDKYLNPLNSIRGQEHVFLLKLVIIVMISLGFLIGIVLFLGLHIKFYNVLLTYFDLKKFSKKVLSDNLTSKKKFAKTIFVIGTLYAIISHINYLINGDIHAGTLDENILDHIYCYIFIF